MRLKKKKPSEKLLWDFKEALEWKLSGLRSVYKKLGVKLCLEEPVNGFRQISGAAPLFGPDAKTFLSEPFWTPLFTRDGYCLAVREDDVEADQDKVVFFEDLQPADQLWILAFIWDSGVSWWKSGAVAEVYSPEELVLDWTVANGGS